MKIFHLTTIIGLMLLFNCSSDSSSNSDDDSGPIEPILDERVEVYEPSLMHNNVVLAMYNGGTEAFIINKEGHRLFTWELSDNLGNDFELLPNGQAIGMFKVENPQIIAGGNGGLIKRINPDMSVDWEFEYSSPTYIAHHDVELLPNGNVLFMVWELIDVNTAQQAGINTTVDIIPDKLVEVDPETNDIVWEWRTWDHRIQDVDSNAPHFGVIADNPHRIDLNYNAGDNGDITHANGIDYDEEKDIIYISVNFYDEIWVIDHSTTTEEAASSSGGNFNKGGDLIYRFGNPLAYNNAEGDVLFDRNHFPNLLEDGVPGEGNMLVYVNGVDAAQSSVYELDLPDTFTLLPNTNNEPSVVWSFTDEDLFFQRISGATRLSNGNTLICEGDYGYWEVTPNGEIAWKFNSDLNVWRGYDYDLDYTGLPFLGITF